MSYALVLNGCSKTCPDQAKALTGFRDAFLAGFPQGKTIIFFNEEKKKQSLINASPTALVELVKIERFQPETVLTALKNLEHESCRDFYLFPGDQAGSELAVRFASRMGGSSLVNVHSLETGPGSPACRKAVYNNYLEAEFSLDRKPYCLSLQKSFSAHTGKEKPKPPEVKVMEHNAKELNSNKAGTGINGTGAPDDSFVLDCKFTESDETTNLESARFILAAGRGVKNRSGLEKVEKTAAVIGAEVGVSRPVAMNAWAPLSKLIGVSGHMTGPELCITAGISGAAAFFAGIEKSACIAAINTDPGAPIIRSSDLAIIDDYEPVLEELERLIIENKQTEGEGK